MSMMDPDNFRFRFLQVIDELRAALGYPLRNDEPEHGDELAMEMMYGGFDFAVVHTLRRASDRVLIECVFGDIPEGKSESVLNRLLEMNAALAEVDGSVFCLDETGTKLLYTLAMDLPALDGSALLKKMTEIVWHGRRWLETRYLNDRATERGELLNPVQLA
jgi:hypothetical protein